MGKISWQRALAILFFGGLIAGAVFCFQRLSQDIGTGRYFSNSQETKYEIVFILSYILIILFMLRYGYYLAVNRVDWAGIKDDFLYLLNKKYFTQGQWIVNVLLFWLALAGFIYSLSISVMKGSF